MVMVNVNRSAAITDVIATPAVWAIVYFLVITLILPVMKAACRFGVSSKSVIVRVHVDLFIESLWRLSHLQL